MLFCGERVGSRHRGLLAQEASGLGQHGARENGEVVGLEEGPSDTHTCHHRQVSAASLGLLICKVGINHTPASQWVYPTGYIHVPSFACDSDVG